jgi:tRNA(fMet)-specific endonuclease VapC
VSIRYLLDANVLSEPIKSCPDEHTIESLSEHDGELATCSVVWHELCFEAARLTSSKKRSAIEAYLEEVVRSTLPILPYDQEAASWHARERARLSKRGRAPSAADGQIAAIAVTSREHDPSILTDLDPSPARRLSS